MSLRGKKMTVFHLMIHTTDPISLKDLIQKLGDGYSEGTVRRWLNEKVKIGHFKKFREKKSFRYQAAIKALSFDEIRVRYREQRRGLVRKIILKCPPENTLKKWVVTKANKSIPEKDRAAFVEDVYEDLKEMHISRLAGLGITEEDLDRWMKKSFRHNL